MICGSLFSGIGGFDLAAHWMGWSTAWFSEIDPYASAVLKKHWPNVPNHGDITKISARTVDRVDMLTGGFPCQDISVAGKGVGLDGARSGLWHHYARLIEEIRPRYAIIENSPMLRSRGLDQVLQKLDQIGYDAEWHCIPASYVGALHRRDRIWIVAYPAGEPRPESRHETQTVGDSRDSWVELGWCSARFGVGESKQNVADADEQQRGAEPQRDCSDGARSWNKLRGSSQITSVADANGEHVEHMLGGRSLEGSGTAAPAGTLDADVAGSGGARTRPSHVADGLSAGLEGHAGNGSLFDQLRWNDAESDGPAGAESLRGRGYASEWWAAEPAVGRVANGVPSRVDRLRCIGNSIVPQVAFLIFQAIALRESRP